MKMRKLTMLLSAASLIALAGLCACSRGSLVERETLLGQNWGRSYETAKYTQMLNPAADRNLQPVLGTSGVAAGNSINKYDDSFKDKKSQEITNILKLQ